MAEVVCKKVWEGNEGWTEPCHLPAGHKDGCAFHTKNDPDPDVLDRLENALAEATTALSTLRKRGLDCD